MCNVELPDPFDLVDCFRSFAALLLAALLLAALLLDPFASLPLLASVSPTNSISTC
jgi:hypothetical protein